MKSPHLSAASIDLISLRLLLVVAAEGSLARAAARENIAISAASRRISNLEARLGVLLLHRHDRGVELTEAAQMVLPWIRSVFGLLDQVIEELGEVRDGSRGLIRIQAHTTTVAGRLPEFIAEFLREYPNIDVTLDEATSTDIVHAVNIDACDIGLVAGTLAPTDVELIPWSNDRLVAVLPATHALSKQESVTFSQMLESPFICMQRDSALVAQCRNEAAVIGKSIMERAHVSSFEAACRMVGRGLGVAIAPAALATEAVRGSDAMILHLQEKWADRPLMLCVRNLTKANASSRSLIEFLLARR